MDEDLAALFVLGQRLMLYGEAKSLELTQEVQRDSSVIHSIVAELLPLVMGKRVMLTDLIAGSRNGKCGTLAVLPRDRARHQALVTEGRVDVHLDGGEGIRVRPRNLVSASVDPAVQRVLARMGTPCRGLDAAREWAKMGTGTDAEGGDVAVVRAVLDAGEIAEVLALAELQGERRRNESTLAGLDKRVGPDGSPLAAGAPLAAEIDGRPHDVCYSNQHIALYLHVDGYLQREHPQVWDHLLRAMCEQPGEWYDPSTPLRVRCIELHSCAARKVSNPDAHYDDSSFIDFHSPHLLELPHSHTSYYRAISRRLDWGGAAGRWPSGPRLRSLDVGAALRPVRSRRRRVRHVERPPACGSQASTGRRRSIPLMPRA